MPFDQSGKTNDFIVSLFKDIIQIRIRSYAF
jgi:hypothetical protein